jgi:hypothetical protein
MRRQQKWRKLIIQAADVAHPAEPRRHRPNGSTELTAFTDGCPGLRRILADSGVAETPILDWFHIGMTS